MTTIFASMSEKDKEVRLDVRHEIIDIMLGLIEILIVHNVLFPSIPLGVGITIGQRVFLADTQTSKVGGYHDIYCR